MSIKRVEEGLLEGGDVDDAKYDEYLAAEDNFCCKMARLTENQACIVLVLSILFTGLHAIVAAVLDKRGFNLGLLIVGAVQMTPFIAFRIWAAGLQSKYEDIGDASAQHADNVAAACDTTAAGYDEQACLDANNAALNNATDTVGEAAGDIGMVLLFWALILGMWIYGMCHACKLKGENAKARLAAKK